MYENKETSTAKNRIEDLDLLDVVRFLWLQKALILLGAILGLSAGLILSLNKMNSDPFVEYSFTFDSKTSDSLSMAVASAEDFVGFINSTQGSSALYDSMKKLAPKETVRLYEEVSPQQFRSYVYHVEKLNPNELLLRIRLPSSYYYKGFEKALESTMAYLVEKYNRLNSDPSLQFYNDLFDLELRINASLLQALNSWELTSASASEKRVIAALGMKVNESFQTKLDLINLISQLLPATDPKKATLQAEGRQLYDKWRLTQENIEQAKVQRKDLLSLPWPPLSLKESKAIEVNTDSSLFTVMFPRVMTGLFLGVVLGLLAGAIRGFAQKHRVELRKIFQHSHV